MPADTEDPTLRFIEQLKEAREAEDLKTLLGLVATAVAERRQPGTKEDAGLSIRLMLSQSAVGNWLRKSFDAHDFATAIQLQQAAIDILEARGELNVDAEKEAKSVIELMYVRAREHVVDEYQNLKAILDKEDAGGTQGVAESLVRSAEPFREREPLLFADALSLASRGFEENHDYLTASKLFAESMEYLQRGFEISDGVKPGGELSRGARFTIANRRERLGKLYEAIGNFAGAAEEYHRSLEIREALGHSDRLGSSYNRLGLLYLRRGDASRAERLLERAVVIAKEEMEAAEKAFPGFDEVLGTLNGLNTYKGNYADALHNVALAKSALSKEKEALDLFEVSLSVDEKLRGKTDPELTKTLSNMAMSMAKMGDVNKAIATQERGLALLEPNPKGHELIQYEALLNLAFFRLEQGSLGEARKAAEAALLLGSKTFAAGDFQLVRAFAANGIILLREKSYGPAYKMLAKGTDICLGALTAALEKAAPGEDQYLFFVLGKCATPLSGELAVVTYLLKEGDAETEARWNRAFSISQWLSASEAGLAVARMGMRLNSSVAKFQKLAREHQDLLIELDKLETEASMVSASPGKGKEKQLVELRRRIAGARSRIRELNALFGGSGLAKDVTMSVSDIQSWLLDDEVLLQIVAPASEVVGQHPLFVWMIPSRGAPLLKRVDADRSWRGPIAALRCGLDDQEWAHLSDAARCGKLLGIGRSADGDPLPFHLGIAHLLYKSVFDGFQEYMKGKQLLIVPSASWKSAPFNVLVTRPPEHELPKDFDGYRDIAWLGAEHAISILPSIGNLKALRERIRYEPADDNLPTTKVHIYEENRLLVADSQHRHAKPYLAFGDPLLDGDGNCGSPVVPATCPGNDDQNENQHRLGRRSTTRAVLRRGDLRPGRGITDIFGTDVESGRLLKAVRRICPLPDSAYEIQCIAERLGALKSELHLKSDASEANLKQLSEEGRLADYSVLHFATHGLVAGDMTAMGAARGEPALVLTPPQSPADDDDDGLLTASEVAKLQLDADWVVLSACNTASAEAGRTEALSGLARAFFYAGARSLLVSHWPVYSDAAVSLATHAFRTIEADPTVGRAEALRRSMIALMRDASQVDNVHPAVWAPFEVVGEGHATVIKH